MQNPARRYKKYRSVFYRVVRGIKGLPTDSYKILTTHLESMFVLKNDLFESYSRTLEASKMKNTSISKNSFSYSNINFERGL